MMVNMVNLILLEQDVKSYEYELGAMSYEL